MYNKNVEKLLKKLGWDSLEELQNGMNSISETSKRIIEIRLGLVGNAKACHSYEQLNKKLGITNSKQAYEIALRELKNWEFTKVIVDFEKIPYEQAVNIGKLSNVILGTANKETIIGEALLHTIDTTLLPRESKIIKLRFGLERPYLSCTLEEVAKEFNLTHERIRQTEVKVLRKLRHPVRLRSFYTVAKAKYEEYLKVKASEPKLIEGLSENDDIKTLNFSVRTFFCLRKAGIKDIKSFICLTKEDVLKIRNLGHLGVKEIEKVRLAIGIPLL